MHDCITAGVSSTFGVFCSRRVIECTLYLITVLFLSQKQIKDEVLEVRQIFIYYYKNKEKDFKSTALSFFKLGVLYAS